MPEVEQRLDALEQKLCFLAYQSSKAEVLICDEEAGFACRYKNGGLAVYWRSITGSKFNAIRATFNGKRVFFKPENTRFSHQYTGGVWEKQIDAAYAKEKKKQPKPHPSGLF